MYIHPSIHLFIHLFILHSYPSILPTQPSIHCSSTISVATFTLFLSSSLSCLLSLHIPSSHIPIQPG